MDKKVNLTKYLVSDEGIKEIDEKHEAYYDEEAPVFDSFTPALLTSIEYLSIRVKDLELELFKLRNKK